MRRLIKMDVRDGRFCTPAPDPDRRDETRTLVYSLRAEARDQRDEADDAERMAMEMNEKGDAEAEWIAQAQAFKRRIIARKAFHLADLLESYINGREALDTTRVNGRDFTELFGKGAGS